MLCFAGACAGPRESANAPERSGPPPPSGLAAATDEVRSIQLYGARERDLPILSLTRGGTLTLEFDLLDTNPRALSVYYYHADRSWRRDLTAAEYLSAFHRDDLFDYRLSRSTRIGYTHYAYSFPNSSIGFRISGNYILRVTEQGREDAVLFERPFFVTEDAASLRFGLDRLLTGRQVLPTIQPIVQFAPPPDLLGTVFDYVVCFARNGRFEQSRCTDSPSLTVQPDLLFYLEPDLSFAPQEGDYYVDLRDYSIGGAIERIDHSVSPIAVSLVPDYARFPASSLAPLLAGQPVIGGADRYVGEADVQGEYADVLFRYVPPDEAPLAGGIFLVGSFNGWNLDLANELRWNADEKWYELAVLLKQGEYDYRYTSPVAHVRRAISSRSFRPDNLFTALVYYTDRSLSTDRLLGFRHMQSQ